MGTSDPTRDQRLAAIAGRQHGTVAYWQLREIGFSAKAIKYRVATGRLHRLFLGVYAVGHTAVSVEGWQMAAVLACGEGAVLSHWTAAARWRLLRPSGGPIHVSASRDRRIQGIRVHQVNALHPDDITKRDGIPITTVPRTLLDLAAIAKPNVLARAVNQAERLGWLNRRLVQELLARNPRRRGTRRLRVLIAAVDPQTFRTRSDFEVAFRRLCRKHAIEPPISNARVAGHEVDMYWPRAGLIVELDDYDYHRTPAEFTNDRRKWAHLSKLGYEVLPVSDEWAGSDPEEVAETVIALLRQWGDTGGSIASSE